VSLNQWLGKKKSPENKETSAVPAESPRAREQKQEPPKPLDEAEKAALLKPKIRKILGKKEGPVQEPDSTKEVEAPEETTPSESLEQEYLAELERLKAWITPRTYLKADLDTAGTIISGIATIYRKLKGSEEQKQGDFQAKIHAISTKELYQRVPMGFLPDPVRRALIRLIQGKPEQKDSYQIRKIQKDAEEALKTTQIYQIILELIDRAKIKAKIAKKKVNQTSPDA
jgi:hypothetical protein